MQARETHGHYGVAKSVAQHRRNKTVVSDEVDEQFLRLSMVGMRTLGGPLSLTLLVTHFLNGSAKRKPTVQAHVKTGSNTWCDCTMKTIKRSVNSGARAAWCACFGLLRHLWFGVLAIEERRG